MMLEKSEGGGSLNFRLFYTMQKGRGRVFENLDAPYMQVIKTRMHM